MSGYPNPYSVKARRDELMRLGEQEQLAAQVQSENVVHFHRTVELLVGWMKSHDGHAKKVFETYEPITRPSKLATDSGIHTIR